MLGAPAASARCCHPGTHTDRDFWAGEQGPATKQVYKVQWVVLLTVAFIFKIGFT